MHADVLTELREIAEVHLGYGPTAVTYQQVQDTVDAVLLRAEIFDRDKIANSPRLEDHRPARHRLRPRRRRRRHRRRRVGHRHPGPQQPRRRRARLRPRPGAGPQGPAAAGRTRDGFWSQNKAELTGFELHGRTLGLLGLGSIGSLVAQIARGFGMQVLVTDPALDAEQVAAVGGRKVEFDELLAGSDVLSLHVPLIPPTRHIIDAARWPGSAPAPC